MFLKSGAQRYLERRDREGALHNETFSSVLRLKSPLEIALPASNARNAKGLNSNAKFSYPFPQYSPQGVLG